MFLPTYVATIVEVGSDGRTAAIDKCRTNLYVRNSDMTRRDLCRKKFESCNSERRNGRNCRKIQDVDVTSEVSAYPITNHIHPQTE